MKFTNIESAKTAVNSLNTDKGGRRIYGVMLKKAVIEYMLSNYHSASHMGKELLISAVTICEWKKQYHAGLYTLEGCVTVSKPVLKVNLAIKQQIKSEIDTLTKKLRLIEQCEKMGLTLAA